MQEHSLPIVLIRRTSRVLCEEYTLWDNFKDHEIEFGEKSTCATLSVLLDVEIMQKSRNLTGWEIHTHKGY